MSRRSPMLPCPFCGADIPDDTGIHPANDCWLSGFELANNYGDEAAWNRRAPDSDTGREEVEEEALNRKRLVLEGHECETILDLTRFMADGSEVGGHSRIWRLGRLTKPIDGAPAERWCLHYRTAWKPEIVFGFNEADMNFLVVTAFAALGYHTSQTWVERMAGKSTPTPPEGGDDGES